MKKKAIPPFVMTAGQRGRLKFEFSVPEGAAEPELRGALMVHGERVDMEAGDGELTIPALPAGVYLAEVRAGGVCVLYGHVEVLPSPLYEVEGEAVYRVGVEDVADVLRVRVELTEGPKGEDGDPAVYKGMIDEALTAGGLAKTYEEKTVRTMAKYGEAVLEVALSGLIFVNEEVDYNAIYFPVAWTEPEYDAYIVTVRLDDGAPKVIGMKGWRLELGENCRGRKVEIVGFATQAGRSVVPVMYGTPGTLPGVQEVNGEEAGATTVVPQVWLVWIESEVRYKSAHAERVEALEEHASDTEVHVTAGERARWDEAAGDAALQRGDNTFTGTNTFVQGVHALPLGVTTALGAPACGLSVSASGGLQLWGTHFLQGDVHDDRTLKIVHDSLSLGSTDEAAVGFDYANTVRFRTMPNDGSSANDSAGGVYRFEAWQWADDSHTSKKEMAVDIRKPNAGVLCDESLMNRAEVDAEITQKIPLAYTTYSSATAPLAKYGGGIALGHNSAATTAWATAIGEYSKAEGMGSVALGYGANCKGSVAIGNYVNAAGNCAIAVGLRTNATGAFSAAIGYEAKATGPGSTALGKYAQGLNDGALALGLSAYAEGKYSTAIGNFSSVKDNATVVLGAGFRDDENVNFIYHTRLYLMAAGSELANKYEDGAACMGYVVKEGNTIVECGTRKLSEIFTNNTAFAPTDLETEATPFMPTGITDPIEEVKEEELAEGAEE